MSLNLAACHALMFRSYERVTPSLRGYDQFTRDLSAMRQLFARAGIATEGMPAVIVTGSKGKGSTALLTAAFLQAMGHKVGLVTSPNYLDLRERVRLNGRMIPEADYMRIINTLAPHLDAVEAVLPPGKYLSPTGLFLAVALCYFAEQQATALVLEVGRGGRFDDISLYRNTVAVFMPIMGEHLDKMGPTVADIAWHKSGIIAPGCTVVSVPQSAQVGAIIAREAAAQSAALLQIGQDVTYTQSLSAAGQQQVTITHKGVAQTFTLATHAIYQGLNAAAAYAAATALSPRAIDAQIVSRLRFAGRCQQVQAHPAVLVDGAINRQAAELARASLLPLKTSPLVLVTALPHDKDDRGLLETLAPHADTVIVTRVSAGHLHFNDNVLHTARRLHSRVIDQPDVDAAFSAAQEYAGSAGTIWVVGTQSLVRDALRFWRQDLLSVFAED
ncbi:MAG: hypothetical protein HXY40_18790 [Chloroflexi bacterium]|nr:hypothetical protein [Chloroflexota bacterium]